MAGNGTLDVSVGDDVAADLAGELNFGSSVATVDYRYEKRLDFGRAIDLTDGVVGNPRAGVQVQPS